MVIGLMVLLVESARVGDESMLAVEEQAIVEQLRSIGLSVDDRFTWAFGCDQAKIEVRLVADEYHIVSVELHCVDTARAIAICRGLPGLRKFIVNDREMKL